MTSLERPDYRVIVRPQVEDHRAAEKEIEHSDSLELFVLRALRRYWLIATAVFVWALFRPCCCILFLIPNAGDGVLLIDNGRQRRSQSRGRTRSS